MAEKKEAAENADKELDLENQSADSEIETAGKSKKKLIAIAAMVLVLVGGGGAAYMLVFVGSNDAVENTEEATLAEQVPEGSIEYIKLDPPFVVNFSDRGRQRFVQAEITLMTRDPDMVFVIDQHMPLIRHNITNVLGAQTMDTIRTAEGINQVRIETTSELQRMLDGEIGNNAIEEVLFTSFVMQ